MAKKVNVLLVGPEPSNKGGVTVWMGQVLDYMNSIKPAAVCLEFLPVSRTTVLSSLLPRYKRLLNSIKDYGRTFLKYIKTLNRSSYDVVHIISSGSTGLFRDWLFVKTSLMFGARPIVHYHCGTIPDSLQSRGVQSVLLKRIASIGAKIIVLDTASKDALNDAGFCNVVKLENPYNKLIDDNRSKKYERVPRELLFVGHVIPTKGIFELVQATHDLEHICLKIYGPEDAAVKNKILEYCNDFRGKIEFYGLQKPEIIYREMMQASLFVLPSYTEGFPFVIVEAMACGCPIVSTPVGAIPEMLTCDGELQGFLIPPKDTVELRRQLEYCLNHPEECLDKAHIAQDKAVNEYSVRVIMSKLLSIWEGVQ